MHGLPIRADLGAVVTASDRTEMRVRAPGSVPPSASIDFETAPQLGLTLTSPQWRYTLGYKPRLTFWDLNVSGVHPVLFDEGIARVEWLGRRTTLSLTQVASYGGVNFAALGPTPGADGTLSRVQVIPSAQVIYYMSSTTTLAAHSDFRRATADLHVGYQLAGGATTDARQALPLQSGPFGDAQYTHEVTRIDYLPTTVSASEASFSSGPEIVLTELDEGWRHLWSRITETRLALGVSEARVRANADAPHTFKAYPVAEGILEHRLSPHDDVRLDVRVGPFVNRLIGFVDEQAQATLAATRTRRRFASHAYLTAAQSTSQSEANAVRFASGEIGGSYGTSELVSFDAGVRGLWQHQDPFAADLLQATFFIGLTFRAPPTKL